MVLTIHLHTNTLIILLFLCAETELAVTAILEHNILKTCRHIGMQRCLSTHGNVFVHGYVYIYAHFASMFLYKYLCCAFIPI